MCLAVPGLQLRELAREFMKKDELQRLLELYEKGRLSPGQKAEVDNLVDNFHTGTEMELGESETRMWSGIERATSKKASGYAPRWMVAAAVILILFAAGIIVYLTFTPSQANKVILPDGSLVWLKERAVIDYSENTQAHTREVRLKGEALFEVARDPLKPFVIHCGKYTATAIGTSFNIKSDNDRVELTVLTGRVRLAYENDSAIIVHPKEQVVLAVRKVVETKLLEPGKELRSVTANTGYDMHFEDTRMEEIVQRIESKFDVEIVVDQKSLRNCMISADFTDQSLPVTLAMISEALGVTYSMDGNRITLSGAGCPD